MILKRILVFNLYSYKEDHSYHDVVFAPIESKLTRVFIAYRDKVC